MPRISVEAFAGMMPRIAPERLDASAAQDAVNAKLTSGALEPWRQTALVTTLSGVSEVKTIYRFGQSVLSETNFWFQFTTDVDVVKAPLDNDTEERTFWTDGVFPKKTRASMATATTPYPSNSLRLGVPSPSFTESPFQTAGYVPAASVTGSPTDPTSTAVTSVYWVTYVSGWLEEGSPSLPSNAVTWRAGQTVTITLPVALTGPYDISRVRLYRSNSGTARTAPQFVKEVVLGPASTTDTTPNSALEEVLPTWDWDMPADNMVGLTHMSNGVLAGFFGNTLCFCEPYVPYAWPIKYRLSTDAPIVGIGAYAQSLYVGTTRGGYVVTGIDPAGGMVMERLNLSQACVSKRSIVQMLGGVVFASPDGLFLVSARGIENLTEPILTRDEWQAYNPASINGYEIDGRYYAFYDNGTPAGLIFTFGALASFVKTDQWVSAAYQEKLTDTLFVVQNNTQLRKWDAGAAMTVTWKSKEFGSPYLVNMTCARLVADAYPWTFKLYSHGVLKHTTVVTNSTPFRLPSGYSGIRTSFEVSGTGRLTRVALATTMGELGGGD